MTDALLDRLQRVFRQVFNAPALVIRPELTAADVAGWDSLKHVELIMSVEAEFGVRFKTAEIASMQNVGDLIARLGRKLGG